MKTEPLVTLASITAGATALLGLLVAFGVPLTEGQQVAVLAVVAVAAPFVVALAGRGQVTPNASVVELALPTNTPGKRLVVAGEANELETGKTIRVLEDDDPGSGHTGRLAHGGPVRLAAHDDSDGFFHGKAPFWSRPSAGRPIFQSRLAIRR